MTEFVPEDFSLDAVFRQAFAHHQAGRLQEAERLYRVILQAHPNHPDANHNLGVLAMQVGQHSKGLPYLSAALAINPSQGQYSLSYAKALLATGEARDALAVLDTAMQRGLDTPATQALRQAAKAVAREGIAKCAAPAAVEVRLLVDLFDAGRYVELESLARFLVERYSDSGFAWKALGASLGAQGKDALSALQKAAALLPNDAEAHNNLGNSLQYLGQFDDAEANIRRALAIDPEFAKAHNNLGTVMARRGCPEKALESYRRALEIKPDYAEAHNKLGISLQNLGKFEDALVSYRRAIEIKHDYAEAHNNLGAALQYLGQIDNAVAHYHRALEINPKFVEALNNLGAALGYLGRFEDAVESYQRAVNIKVDYVEAHNNLGNALRSLGRFEEAIESFRRALQIFPNYAVAHNNVGNALQDIGQLDSAIASYRRALEIEPDFAIAYSNLLFLYAYHALIDPRDYLAQAKNWEQVCLTVHDRRAARRRKFDRSPLMGRRLRVGYVSGDYCRHAVSYFVETLFAHHDRSRVEVFAYSTGSQHDAVTRRLQELVEHWVPLAGIPDTVAREKIEADCIDVLIDLTGHSGRNLLKVFARRAAPVQAHYLGYFASMGLSEMDYWIGDEILTPAETDKHFSERVWRLPRVWVSYDGKADAPIPNWRPTQDGVVWLGSFNNLGKITPATLALWARMLLKLPKGKLLLKCKELSHFGNRRRILDVMAGHGIPPELIELQDGSVTPDWYSHMAYYDRLDIALDPVGGHGGGTTTCDALWMAVPVITLKGDRMGSRMSAAMLEAIGRAEWVAHSEMEYIDKVVALARDVDLRKALRSSQRKRMAESPLCDARDMVTSLENAYFEMFARWLKRTSRKQSRV